MLEQAMHTDLHSAPGAAQWDYKVTSIHTRHNDGLEEQLKEFGRNGWELVCVNLPLAYEYQCIFRRPVTGGH